MSRRPPRPTQSRSSAASDVYKRQKTLHGTSRPATIREGCTPRSATVHPTKCTTPTDQNKWPHSKDRITVQEIQSRSDRQAAAAGDVSAIAAHARQVLATINLSGSRVPLRYEAEIDASVRLTLSPNSASDLR